MSFKLVSLLVLYEFISAGSADLVSQGKMVTVSKSVAMATCAATDGDKSTPCRASADPALLPYPGSYIILDLAAVYTISRIVIWPIESDKQLCTGFEIFGFPALNESAQSLCNIGNTPIVTNFECNDLSKAARYIKLYKYYIFNEDLLIAEIEVYTNDILESSTKKTTLRSTINSLPPSSSISSLPSVSSTSPLSSPPSLFSSSYPQPPTKGPLVDSSEASGDAKVVAAILGALLGLAVIVIIVLAIVVCCLVRRPRRDRAVPKPVLPSVKHPHINRNKGTYINYMTGPNANERINNSYIDGASFVNNETPFDTVRSGPFLEPNYDNHTMESRNESLDIIYAKYDAVNYANAK